MLLRSADDVYPDTGDTEPEQSQVCTRRSGAGVGNNGFSQLEAVKVLSTRKVKSVRRLSISQYRLLLSYIIVHNTTNMTSLLKLHSPMKTSNFQSENDYLDLILHILLSGLK